MFLINTCTRFTSVQYNIAVFQYNSIKISLLEWTGKVIRKVGYYSPDAISNNTDVSTSWCTQTSVSVYYTATVVESCWRL